MNLGKYMCNMPQGILKKWKNQPYKAFKEENKQTNLLTK